MKSIILSDANWLYIDVGGTEFTMVSDSDISISFNIFTGFVSLPADVQIKFKANGIYVKGTAGNKISFI